MKKVFFLSFFSILFLQCTSIKEHNEHLDYLIHDVNLKADVDFTYKKLQRLQPKLYWYISKKELDYKFDSLKNTITKPMTGYEFYKKLSPVVASIRQGHLTVSPPAKILSRSELKAIKEKGIGPFSQFEFEIINDKIYVIKNKSVDSSIKIGDELVAINNKKTSELLTEYNTLFTSDGYNKTFKRKRMSNLFSVFYTYENGIQDNLFFSFKQNDTLKDIWIKRKKPSPVNKQKSAIQMSMISSDHKQI